MRKWLIRTYYNVINPFRRLYWFIFRPKTRGVKCVIRHDAKYFLVRIGYNHKKWTIPGGGVKRNETFETAVRREIFEETGIKITKTEMVLEYQNIQEYKRDTVQVFFSDVNSAEYAVDGIEVVEAGWFSPDALPKNRVPRVDKIFSFLHESSHLIS